VLASLKCVCVQSVEAVSFDNMPFPLDEDLESQTCSEALSTSSIDAGNDRHGFLIKLGDGDFADVEDNAGDTFGPRSWSHLLGDHLARQAGTQGPESTTAGRAYMLALPDAGEDGNVAFKNMVLPSDIADVTVRAQHQHRSADGGEKVTSLQLTVHRKAPIFGYVMLVLALLGVASLGAG